MWIKSYIESAYVYHELDGTPCFEYCTEYVNEEGDVVFVPDSMKKEFIENHEIEED